ncbi:MAG: aminotransferase class V-fold PLP-dependent enzyme [Thermodesulfobacteriota bacterium]
MNFDSYRRLFPILDKYIYLDHSGIGPVSLRVRDAVSQFIESAAGEGGFTYKKWMEKVENSRKICADLIGAENDEVAFVKSTSHGISLVASGLKWKKGDNLLVYEKEFPSNIYPWLNLQKKGVEIKFIKDDKGEINLSEIEKLADSNTRLLSISSVQYSNGFKADLEKIGEFCSSNNILFFVDAIQSLGVLPMDVKKFKIDFLSADGHKWMLSLEGTGIFYCSKYKAHLITPSLLGWKSIIDESNYGNINFVLKENALKFEEGSLNVIGIIAMGEAVALLSEIGIPNIQKKVQSLGNLTMELAGNRNYKIISPLDISKRGGIVSFSGDFDKQKLRDKLEENNIMVNFRGGAIRVSPHFYNNKNDIENLFQKIDKLI